MGYIFLTIALLAGVTKGYCGKKTSFSVTTTSDSMVMNLLRMLVCIAFGFLLIAFQGELGGLKLNAIALLAALLSGAASAAFVVSWLLSVKTGAYMMVEVFLLLGTIVTIGFCRVFFSEAVSIWQIVGILLLLASVYIMCTYNSGIKGKMKPRALILLLLCGLANGTADFSQKIFIKMVPDGSVLAFNFYTYVFAAAVLLMVCIFFRRAESKKNAELRSPLSIVKPIWIYVLVMAVCLFANSLFKTKAAQYLDAISLYPLNQGCGVVLSLLMSSIIFKERINLKCIVGICIAFAALLMINLDISAIFGLPVIKI